MRYHVIACQVMEQELLALATGREEWQFLDQGLHRSPQLLRQALQEAINAATNCDQVILGYGFCGGAVEGLRAGARPLIVPRVDDCIPILLGSNQVRRRWPVGTYFLSTGWLAGEENMAREYRRCLERYGEERGRRILKQLYGHYQNLVFIATNTGTDIMSGESNSLRNPGTCPLQATTTARGALALARQLALNLGLTFALYQGDNLYLKQLLRGPWDDNFLRIEPHKEVPGTAFWNPGQVKINQ